MQKIPTEVFEKAVDAFLLTGRVSDTIADVFENARRRITMHTHNQRYCVLTDNTVIRNPRRRPLLHNGGKPR